MARKHVNKRAAGLGDTEGGAETPGSDAVREPLPTVAKGRHLHRAPKQGLKLPSPMVGVALAGAIVVGVPVVVSTISPSNYRLPESSDIPRPTATPLPAPSSTQGSTGAKRTPNPDRPSPRTTGGTSKPGASKPGAGNPDDEDDSRGSANSGRDTDGDHGSGDQGDTGADDGDKPAGDSGTGGDQDSDKPGSEPAPPMPAPEPQNPAPENPAPDKPTSPDAANPPAPEPPPNASPHNRHPRHRSAHVRTAIAVHHLNRAVVVRVQVSAPQSQRLTIVVHPAQARVVKTSATGQVSKHCHGHGKHHKQERQHTPPRFLTS